MNIYQEVELELDGETIECAFNIHVEISNPSFDHAFGTQHLPDGVDYIELADLEAETPHSRRWDLWLGLLAATEQCLRRWLKPGSRLTAPCVRRVLFISAEIADARNKHKRALKKLNVMAEAWVEANSDRIEELALEQHAALHDDED